jgi:transposase
MKRKKPETIEVDFSQLDELLRRAEGKLDEQDYDLIRAVFESYAYVTDLVEDKNTSIRRLRQLLFGARTEKTDAVVGHSEDATGDDQSSDPADTAQPGKFSEEDTSCPDEADTSPKKGHGRNGADAYRGADQIEVPHESLHAGDACPECDQGKVYEMSVPGVLVRVVGQAPLHAKVYHLQKLRCHLCGKVFTAEAPEDAGARKYDATAGSMIALLKYGSGMPFNRAAGLQRYMEIPLPASTQWDVIAAYKETYCTMTTP